jgi:hypothetical protein
MRINFYVIQNLKMLTYFDKVTCKPTRKIFALLIMNVPIIMVYSKQKLVQHNFETTNVSQLELFAILCVSS